MPNNSIISEGKTTNEAIENGLKKLNVSRNAVNIKVLENEEKRSFFSILAPRVVKVELTLKENSENTPKPKKEKKIVSQESLEKAEKSAKDFLDQFLSQIGQDLTYKIQKNDYGLEIEIEGSQTGLLIGYRGETLYALQTILSSVASKDINERIIVLLDIENYKSKREKTLQELAHKIEKTVAKTKKSVTLEPMQAYERKIIHSALQNSSTVKTVSIGEEPRRRIVISLK